MPQSPLNPKHGQKRLIAFCSLEKEKEIKKKTATKKQKKIGSDRPSETFLSQVRAIRMSRVL